ncbi:DUF4149 domain-containing protein [Parvularcula maris]|uniref:TMEM205-like domain-containing protein n=1 Tax=Parvularcula maris TaxID=2965077 RepID=A0A9X2RGL1_9PROT|nr:DUF4149 domain-containing protein [Parvularcula maris]MCQ8184019.1 hypothetical protein [Parvularcula maris]
MLQEIARTFFAASIFGAILAFGGVVAPTVMKYLEGDEGANFLRRLVPRYYFFLVVTGLLGAFSSWEEPAQAFGMALIAATSLFVREVMLPKLFALRDRQMESDREASAKFVRMRRRLVVLAAAQFLVAGAVLATIAW